MNSKGEHIKSGSDNLCSRIANKDSIYSAAEWTYWTRYTSVFVTIKDTSRIVSPLTSGHFTRLKGTGETGK
ncbi:unnamed protein product [Fusarium graminearum]|nr:unnamed protein product [Fusarium graminearum]CAG1966813.1 unnamed protein product [Fusarium graminearum]